MTTGTEIRVIIINRRMWIFCVLRNIRKVAIEAIQGGLFIVDKNTN